MLAAVVLAVGLHFTVATTTIRSYICSGTTKPLIATPIDGSTVTAGPVTITGNATAGSQVTLALDGQSVVTTSADQYDTFSAQINLPEGTHDVGIASASPCGNRTGDDITLLGVAPPPPPVTNPDDNVTPIATSTSTEVSQQNGDGSAQTSTMNPTPEPDLQITLATPRDKSRTTSASVYVSGTLSVAGTVRISRNGTLIAQIYQPSTSFGFSIPLDIGPNTLAIEAQANNQAASASLRVTRVQDKSSASQSVPWWHSTPFHIAVGVAVAGLIIGLLIWFIVLAI